jgi:class 3 adenylate cyclase/Tfp pilus assembly protein PilF
MSSDIAVLQEEIASMQGITSTKIDALNKLASLLFDTNPVESNDAAQQAIALSREAGYMAGEAFGLLYAGMYASQQRNYAAAQKLFADAIAIWMELGNEEKIALAETKLGTTFLYTGNYPEALTHYNTAIAIREKLNDTLGAADLYTNSGIIHGFQGNHTLALKSHLKAFDTYEKLGEETRIASSSNNIGLIYYEQKNYEESLKMFEKALVIRQQKNDTKSLSDILDNIGMVHRSENKFDQALDYYQQAQRLREKIGDKAKLGSSYSKIGRVYKDLGQLTIAIGYYETAFELFKETDEKRGIVQSYLNLGEAYLEKRDYNKAEELLNNAAKNSIETGLKIYLRDSLQSLSTLYAIQQNYEKAYTCFVEFTSVDKEISNSDISKQIAQMTMRHEIEQREREAEFERAKNIELKTAYDSLDEEKKRSEKLLHNILPVQIADEIKQFGKTEAKYYKSVTVMFCDIVGFTTVSEQLTPQQLIAQVDFCYSKFDEIIEKYGLEKIKIIGDSYMCAGGLPIENETHATDIIKAAHEMLEFTNRFSDELKSKKNPEFRFRFGINTGPVVAGVVGKNKFAYDIWGDTVNVAARMEQNSISGKINISGSTHTLVKDFFNCEYRGKIEAKNKGEIDMYYVHP